MKRKIDVRKHVRKTKKGFVPVRRHTKKIVFNDGKKRLVPIINPMRPKDLKEKTIPKGNWLGQEKKDGSLTIQYKVPGAVAYVNRRFSNKTPIYPDLTDDEVTKIPVKGLTITQGEAYVMKGGKDSFDAFLKRDLLQDPEEAKKRTKDYPLTYEVFDIMMKDGEWLTNKPLKDRLEVLRKTFKGKTKELKVSKTSPYIKRMTSKLRQDPTVEGIIYKKANSKYSEGKSSDWLKNKFRKEADVMITGYNPGKGKRSSTFGTLKASIYDKKTGKPKEVANVGTGFNDEQLKDLKKRIDKGEKVFGKVKYLNIGSQGRLRMPVWIGRRTDLKNLKETHI